MATLMVRNVPADVAKQLSELAKRESISVNTLVLRELEHLARRARNAALVDSWPSYDVSLDDILQALHEGRAERDRDRP